MRRRSGTRVLSWLRIALCAAVIAAVTVTGVSIAESSGDPSSPKATAAAGKRGPRGKAGPAGPRGPQGAEGVAGANGTNGTNGAPGANGAAGSTGGVASARYAVVDSNGTLSRSQAVTGVTRVGTGSYRVAFNQNVRPCGYVAAIGLSGAIGSSPPGMISVAGDPASSNGVTVNTTNATGAATDMGFHMAVFC